MHAEATVARVRAYDSPLGDAYVDLGNGTFFAPDAEWAHGGREPVGVVVDGARGGFPYGPAAWSGEVGPLRGFDLLTVRGHGPSAPATCFPGIVDVSEHGWTLGLSSIDGQTFAGLPELASSVARILGRPPEGLPVGTAADRMAAWRRARAMD